MLEVEVMHPCEKPSMLVETVTIPVTRWERFWGHKPRKYNRYFEKTAKWTCPECKSRWIWWGDFWQCTERARKTVKIDESQPLTTPTW